MKKTGIFLFSTHLTQEVLILNWKGFFLILITVSFTICGQILMKKGMLHNEAMTFKSIISNYFLLIGGLCYVAGFIFWLGVLSILPLSIAYPSSSIAYVGVIIASAFFLSEPVTFFKIIGISLICLGVFFISRS